MINIKLLKQGKKNFSDILRGSESRRYGEKSSIDQIISLENNWKTHRYLYDKLKKNFTVFSKLAYSHEKLSASTLKHLRNLKKKLSFLEKKTFSLEKIKSDTIKLIGNLIHNSGMFGKEETKMRQFWVDRNFSSKKFRYNHVDLLKMIGGVDYKRGTSVSGQRGYFLKGPGLIINISILRFAIDFLSTRNYIPLQTPLFMNKKKIKKCCQLIDFNEQLYYLGPEEEKYLIATSEQPISSFHFEERIKKKDLPLKYSGYSSCFRKETGSHGQDTSGIFRVHHFEKIEQFIFSDPSFSWKFFEEMLFNAIEFYRSINIPFITLEIPSGSINGSASKKIDLLGWFPASDCYRELVSCSNCTDFQSREMNIIFNASKKASRENYVHLLNSTLCASSRTICCILENCQNEFGVFIPEILRSYSGVSFFPFEK